MNEKIHIKSELFSKLPPSTNEELRPVIREAIGSRFDAIIVLDDDPTGTQTVYDIPVLTHWDQRAIENELEQDTPLFYILTNSRSLVEAAAVELAQNVGRNIRAIEEKLGKKCLVISRSDSTLRGHYPAEVVALEAGLALKNTVHFIVPAFFEGGRYTIDDVHYVLSHEQLIPAAQTPFAEDKVFGYQSSNLQEWVAEKWRDTKKVVESINLEELRSQSMERLVAKINTFRGGTVCVINAAAYSDLQRASIAILRSRIQPVFRTAASFVAALAAQPARSMLTAPDLRLEPNAGGLVIVGSYVPKSTQQLGHLQKNSSQTSIEVDVGQLLANLIPEATTLSKTIDNQLQKGQTVLLFTSRKLVSTKSTKENLAIGERVSKYLTDVVAGLTVRPSYILAKGGITSSDIATESLGVKRAMIKGQILAGVPVWELGSESKFPGISYIVFPGNVGEEDGLTQIVNMLDQNEKQRE